jgi:hypothetical protein
MLTRLLLAGACAAGLAVAPAEARVVVVHGFHGPVFHPGFHPYFHGPHGFYGPRAFFGFGVAPVAPYYPYPFAYYPPAYYPPPPPPPPYPYYYPYGAY